MISIDEQIHAIPALGTALAALGRSRRDELLRPSLDMAAVSFTVVRLCDVFGTLWPAVSTAYPEGSENYRLVWSRDTVEAWLEDPQYVARRVSGLGPEHRHALLGTEVTHRIALLTRLGLLPQLDATEGCSLGSLVGYQSSRFSRVADLGVAIEEAAFHRPSQPPPTEHNTVVQWVSREHALSYANTYPLHFMSCYFGHSWFFRYLTASTDTGLRVRHESSHPWLVPRAMSFPGGVHRDSRRETPRHLDPDWLLNNTINNEQMYRTLGGVNVTIDRSSEHSRPELAEEIRRSLMSIMGVDWAQTLSASVPLAATEEKKAEEPPTRRVLSRPFRSVSGVFVDVEAVGGKVVIKPRSADGK